MRLLFKRVLLNRKEIFNLFFIDESKKLIAKHTEKPLKRLEIR
jgi:hypothetical protein